MSGPEGPEMPLVECRDLWLVQPFHYCEDGSVNESDVRVVIPVAELPNAAVVSGFEIFNAIGTRFDVIQEGHKHSRVHARMNQVVDLDENRCRDDECFFA